VVAPDLPPNQSDQTNIADIDLSTYTDYVVGLIEKLGTKVILVGHSMGGITVSSVAEKRPDLIAHLVYLSAMMLPSGESIRSIRKRFYGDEAAPSESARDWQVAQDGVTAYLDKHSAVGRYYNRCSEDDAKTALTLLRGQPLRLLDEPVAVTEDRWGTAPRTYILTLDDRALPPQLAAYLLEVVGADRVKVIDTDHSSFISRPNLLLEFLLEVDGLVAAKTT
jgi:pimeloyl-ACP methyl ester carboxylesterase